MERLTSNKKVSDMSMIELAHNSCYADDKRNARYRDYEMDMDARDFAKNLMVTLAKDEMPISDTEFDEEILDDLAIDPFSDVRGLIALFYRNLCAMANLRETLKKYEDLEEQGRLIKLPCKVGDTVYVDATILPVNNMECYEDIGREVPVYFQARVVSFRFAKRNWMKIAVREKWLHEWMDDETGPDSDYIECEKNFTISLSGIGKTIFLTKSEAEAKLKELRGSND